MPARPKQTGEGGCTEPASTAADPCLFLCDALLRHVTEGLVGLSVSCFTTKGRYHSPFQPVVPTLGPLTTPRGTLKRPYARDWKDPQECAQLLPRNQVRFPAPHNLQLQGISSLWHVHSHVHTPHTDTATHIHVVLK